MLKNLNNWMLRMYVEKSEDLKENLNRVIRNERGAVAVEYGLVIALVVAVVVAAAYAMKDPLKGFFQSAVATIQGWMTGAPSPTP